VKPGTLVMLPAHGIFGPYAVVERFSSEGCVSVHDGKFALDYEPEAVREVGWMRLSKTYTTLSGRRLARFECAGRTVEVCVRAERGGVEETRRHEMRLLAVKALNGRKRGKCASARKIGEDA
jgi:hypothetical protein